MPVTSRKRPYIMRSKAIPYNWRLREQRASIHLRNSELAGKKFYGRKLHGRGTVQSNLKRLRRQLPSSKFRGSTSSSADKSQIVGSARSVSAAVGVPVVYQSTDDTEETVNTRSVSHRGQELPLTTTMVHVANQVAVPRHTETNNTNMSVLLDELPLEICLGLPCDAACKLLTNTYFEYCEAFAPILDPSSFLAALANAKANENCDSVKSNRPASAIDNQNKFTTMLVFSIGGRLLNHQNRSFPAQRSDAYYASAMRQLSEDDGLLDIAWPQSLENVALLAQYAFLCSDFDSAWYLTGAATSMAMDLGLHRHRGNGSGTANHSTRTKQCCWLFWAIFTLERILCSAICRPFSIPDRAISAKLPELHPRDEPARASAAHLIKFRILHSEIYQAVTQGLLVNEDVADYHVWRDAMHCKLQMWRQSAPQVINSARFGPGEIYDLGMYNAMVLLYFPRRQTQPFSSSDLYTLAQNAVAVIGACKACLKGNKLVLYLHMSHDLYLAGAGLIHCILRLTGHGLTDTLLESWTSSVNSCSAILWALAERHHTGKKYRDMFETIAKATNTGDDSTRTASKLANATESGAYASITYQGLQETILRGT